MNPETILVVDDDAGIRTVAQAALAGLGYTVLETGDPHRAIRLAQEHVIDLLASDPIPHGSVSGGDDRHSGLSC